MDQGPLGLGWSINQVEVSRDSVFVDCWETFCTLVHPDSFSLALNGESYQLKPYGSTSAAVVRYYAHNAPGLFAQRIYSATASGANPDRFYWVVETPDGTTYRLGYTPDAESGQSTWPGNPNTAGHVGYSSNYSGIRWRVDTVTDVYGNQIQYTYAASSFGDSYSSESGSTLQVTSGARRPADIRYNFANRAPNADTRVTGSFASQIVFVATGDNRISDIQLYHFDLVTPQRVVKIGLGGTWHNTCGQSILTNFVTSLREQNASGALALPATTFTHTPLAHGTTGCFIYERVLQVDNGYGGRVRFTYTDTPTTIGATAAARLFQPTAAPIT